MALIKTLVTLQRDHPSGTFRRFGHIFSTTPQVFALTKEQVDELSQIGFVKISTDGEKVARFEPLEAAPVDEGTPEYDRFTKAQLIETLEQSGFVAGQDFDPEAAKKDLISLLTA